MYEDIPDDEYECGRCRYDHRSRGLTLCREHLRRANALQRERGADPVVEYVPDAERPPTQPARVRFASRPAAEPVATPTRRVLTFEHETPE